MQNVFLRGTIYITDNLEYIYNLPVNGMTKIVSLDEDEVLDSNNANVIGGTCLLPPMEAKIAEADGNEQMYDTVYSNHLLSPFQQQFIAALIAFLYKGGNLVLFLPELGYTNTMEKFIFHLFRLYGIHVGLIGHQNPQIANCYYDTSCIPIWLNMIYTADVISPWEYLYMYPVDAAITNQAVMNKLIHEIRPYAGTMNEMFEYIKKLHRKIHKNPKVVPALESIDI